jgi:beta-glucanase (GH16 family)
MNPTLHARASLRRLCLLACTALVVAVTPCFAGAASAGSWKRDKQPPTTPTNLAATSETASTITFTWTASTDNVGVVGYDVSIGSAAPVRVTTLSYTAACGTNVTASVVAVDRAGNRSTAATATGSTSSCVDEQAPSGPTSLSITARSATSLTLSWAASSDNVDVVGYRYYLGTTAIGTTPTTSAVFTGLDCGTEYSLGVDGYDAVDNHSAPSTLTASTSPCGVFDTTAPSPPGALSTSAVTQTGLTLSWAASTDDVGVIGYHVYLGSTLLGPTTGTSYPLDALTCAATYTLSVDAFDAAGNTSAKASTLVTTAECPIPGAEPAPIAGRGYRQVFRDDFDTLDRSVWDDHIWYDAPPPASWTSFQYAQNGIVHLVSSRTNNYPDNTLTTQTSGLTFLQGYFEARMKWTAGHGAWPAFWLYSYRHATNPAWPSVNPYCSQNGLPTALCYAAELDVFEGQGSEPRSYYGTIHRDTSGSYNVGDQQNANNWQDAGVDLTADFHTYGMLWTATQITWYLDGRALMSAPVFDSTNQPMFLLLQMYTGGWTYDPDSTTPTNLETQIDYVQVWQR